MSDTQTSSSPSTETGALQPEVTTPPVENPETENVAPDATAATSTAPAAEPDSDAPTRAQARIEELAAEKQAARDAAEYWRQRALAQAPAATPTPEKQAPKFADYESADDWAAAHAAFVEERAEAKAQAAAKTRLETERAESAAQATRTAFEDRASAFRAKNPTFDAVVGNPRLPITEAMTEVIQASEKGPDLAFHLGMNPDKAARIAMLKTPAQQAAALGRLESELASKPAPAPPKASTRAPAPPSPVGNSQPSKDIADMSIDEYMAHRLTWRKKR